MSDKNDNDKNLPDPDDASLSQDELEDRAQGDESIDPSQTAEDGIEASEDCDDSGDHDPFLDEGHHEDDYMSDYEAELEAEAAARREAGMSFLEHLEEFRWTVGRSVLAFFLGLIIVAIFIQDIAEWLKYPILTAYGSVELVKQNLITYRPMGVISVFFQIALLGGFTLSMPFVLYFLAAFVAPGLTEKERKVLRPSCFAAFLLFLTGVAFAFFIILPLTLAFSVRLNQFFGFDLLWAASDYYSMVVWFSLATGAFFQFPLLIVILVYLQVLPVSKLKAIRKGVFVGLMIFSALMSPGGDFISLPITTGFMYGLYELAIWVGGRIEKKKREEALAEMEE
ncbi:MAG TPA: twin-arginine translocase subunit TatC [Opitutae bacterium]|mgnify:CR=1 FL=1|nr:twin-arginine translocase subunit TatC [Opitutae bacterium]